MTLMGKGMIDQKELEQAFTLFNQVSAELTRSYSVLAARVEELKGELAEANFALRSELTQKEALSRRLTLLLSSLPAGVLVLDRDGKILDANPAAQLALAGVQPGRDWAQISQTLEATHTPHEWIDDKGHRFNVMTAALDTSDERVVLVNDITEDFAAKEEINRGQRLLAMGEMTASLAHQIRTPLSTAMLYASHLGKDRLDSADRQRFAHRLRERLLHLEGLVSNMLLFVRGEQLEQNDFLVSDLINSVEETMSPHFAERDILLRIHRDGDAALRGNFQSLVGVLANLLENALIASSSGKEVRLCAFFDNGVVLRVEDEGCGMRQETISRLFEPFFTTRPNGTGLGLAIVRQIVEIMGGHIEVNTDLGQGSIFSIYLPGERVALPL